MLRAILFDIDGVLIDSLSANAAFYSQLLPKLGYPKPLKQDILNHCHLTLYDSIAYFTQESSPQKLHDYYQIALNTHYPVEKTKPMPNAQATVNDLYQQYKLGIVTSRPRRGTEYFFELFGHKKYFKTTVDVEDYTHPKPDPEPLLIACQRLQVKPNQAVYIGDMPTDRDAAQATGTHFISYGPKPMPDSPYHAISFTHIPRILKLINKNTNTT